MADDVDIRDLIRERLDVSSRGRQLRKKRAEWYRSRKETEDVEIEEAGPIVIPSVFAVLDELKRRRENG